MGRLFREVIPRNDVTNACMVHVVQRYFGELFNLGRLELVDELLHPEYVDESPSPGLPLGRERVRIVVRTLRSAFPDLRYDIEEIVEGSDALAVRTRMRGTHCGELFGIAPTRRVVDVQQMTIERFREGKIVRHHSVSDELSLLRQLGVVASS